MEREPADRYGMYSSTHTAVVVRTRSPTHDPHPSPTSAKTTLRSSVHTAELCTKRPEQRGSHAGCDGLLLAARSGIGPVGSTREAARRRQRTVGCSWGSPVGGSRPTNHRPYIDRDTRPRTKNHSILHDSEWANTPGALGDLRNLGFFKIQTFY